MAPLSVAASSPQPAGTPQPLAISEQAAAGLIGISVRSLQRLRVDGGGPPFATLGRRVVYPRDTLQTWLASRATTSTSAVAVARKEAGR